VASPKKRWTECERKLKKSRGRKEVHMPIVGKVKRGKMMQKKKGGTFSRRCREKKKAIPSPKKKKKKKHRIERKGESMCRKGPPRSKKKEGA